MSEQGDLFPGSKIRHGTTSGWRKHQLLDEDPCADCRQARKEYDAARPTHHTPIAPNAWICPCCGSTVKT